MTLNESELFMFKWRGVSLCGMPAEVAAPVHGISQDSFDKLLFIGWIEVD